MKIRSTRRMKKRLLFGIVAAAAVAALGTYAWLNRGAPTPVAPIFTTTSPNTAPSTSQPIAAATPIPTPPTPVPTATPTPLPKTTLIEHVPFIEQAPHKNWDAVHEETCEEASVLAVTAFWRGHRSLTADEQERELQAIIAWEKEYLGTYEDTTAAQTARILSEYAGFGDRVRLVRNANLEDLKRELAAGRPVLLPAAGREMGNKYFKTPGPIYHMTVAIGYTSNEIITQDPGTRRGENYTYDMTKLWNAVHDFVDRTDAGMARGEKILIVVDPA